MYSPDSCGHAGSDPGSCSQITDKQATQITEIGSFRQDIYRLIERTNRLVEDQPAFGAEATLAKRALQTARHWLGESLAFLPTGYRVTDNPNDPGSESKAA